MFPWNRAKARARAWVRTRARARARANLFPSSTILPVPLCCVSIDYDQPPFIGSCLVWPKCWDMCKVRAAVDNFVGAPLILWHFLIFRLL